MLQSALKARHMMNFSTLVKLHGLFLVKEENIQMLCYDEEMAPYHKRRFKDERFTDLLTQEIQERNTLSRSNNYSMKNT